MRETAFDRPVRVTLGPHGTVSYIVTSPREAAEKLLHDDWPANTGKRQMAARVALLEALENARDVTLAAKARKAFEDAADEAGILMTEMVRPTGKRKR